MPLESVRARALIGSFTAISILAWPAAPSAQAPISEERYFGPDLTAATHHCWFGMTRRRLDVLSPRMREYYAKHWTVAGEPSLFERSKAKGAPASWRFSYLGAFGSAQIVRIDETKGGMRLTFVELSVSGDEPRTVIKRTERSLTPAEQREVRQRIAAVRGMAPAVCHRGYDGVEWIFEEAAKGRYRLVDRWTPQAGPFFNLGETLSRLAEGRSTWR